MKKALKITGITLAVLIALAVWVVAFSGILPYYIVKKYVPCADELEYSEWTHYDSGRLAQYKTVSYDGLYADIPLNMTNNTDSSGKIRENSFTGPVGDERFSMTSRIDAKQSGNILIIKNGKEEPPKEMTEKERKQAEKAKKRYDKELARYCRRIGKEAPRNVCEMMDITYTVDMDDKVLMSRQQEAIHAQFIVLKGIMRSTTDKVYRFENDTGIGYISLWRNDLYDISFFDKQDPDVYYDITVSLPDEDTMYKIVNSLRIDYTPEQEE